MAPSLQQVVSRVLYSQDKFACGVVVPIKIGSINVNGYSADGFEINCNNSIILTLFEDIDGGCTDNSLLMNLGFVFFAELFLHLIAVRVVHTLHRVVGCSGLL